MRKTLLPLTALPSVNSTGAGGGGGLTLGGALSRGLALAEGCRVAVAVGAVELRYASLSPAILLRTGLRQGGRTRRPPGQPRAASRYRVCAAVLPARSPHRTVAQDPARTRRCRPLAPASARRAVPPRARNRERRARVRGANRRGPRATIRTPARAWLESGTAVRRALKAPRRAQSGVASRSLVDAYSQ